MWPRYGDSEARAQDVAAILAIDRSADGLDYWDAYRLALAELGAKAGFGLGDGLGACGGDKLLDIGVGLGVGLRYGKFELFLPCLLAFALFIFFDDIEHLAAQRLAFFFFFGLEELGRVGDDAKVFVEDSVLNGGKLFEVAVGGTFAEAETGLGARVGAGGTGAGARFAGQGGVGDLEAVEDEAGVLAVDGAVGETLEDLADGEQEGGAVLGHGDGEDVGAGAALARVGDLAGGVVEVTKIF